MNTAVEALSIYHFCLEAGFPKAAAADEAVEFISANVSSDSEYQLALQYFMNNK